MAALNAADVTHLIVHCAATRPSQDIGLADIDRWHRERGWKGCGYHWIIRRNGRLEMGRSPRQRGAHCRGYNGRSIGICLAGGVAEDDLSLAEDNFSSAQYETLSVLLLSMSRMFPGAQVVGHRDIPGVAKDCPAFSVADFWQRRGRDKYIMRAGFPTPKVKP